MSYSAKILADSISPARVRLTTMEVTFPRIVLAEFNTHRVFCLAGDSLLEFDLPAGAQKGGRRVYSMRLDEFVEKWIGGARRVGANPKRPVELDWVQVDKKYTAVEVASRLGMASASNVHSLCRTGEITAEKEGRSWLIRGEEVIRWRRSAPENTNFDMRAKLSGMRIRQLNEDTGDVQTSFVTDACVSGVKEVFEVRAGEFRVAGSADHRVLTSSGWKTIGELVKGNLIVVRKFGKKEEDRLDPLRLKKIEGRWRSIWQRDQRELLMSMDPICRRCKMEKGVEVHHLVPVYMAPDRAFDPSNITLLCDRCHDTQHETQDWQGGTYLYGAMAAVDDVVRRGAEQTFDLTIAGRYPNFLANGVVVHNSRNSASSRAIPVEKMLQRVIDDPFLPVWWGKNQSGMQAAEELVDHIVENPSMVPYIQRCPRSAAEAEWLRARDRAVDSVKWLQRIGLHKQIANRLLEPFLWHTVIVTATEWDNFFALRCNKDAQPEIRVIAEMMKKLYVESMPKKLDYGEWHLPLVTDEERDEWCTTTMTRWAKHPLYAPQVCSGRCARVSYLTHDGRRDPEADFELADKLQKAGHMSPFEHAARPWSIDPRSFNGNFRGWQQFRKLLPNEAVFRPEAV